MAIQNLANIAAALCVFACVDSGHANLQPDISQLTGLDVPEGCALTVGGEARRWRAGEFLAFDPSWPHSAENPTAADRYVLLLQPLRDDEQLVGARDNHRPEAHRRPVRSYIT